LCAARLRGSVRAEESASAKHGHSVNSRTVSPSRRTIKLRLGAAVFRDEPRVVGHTVRVLVAVSRLLC
jgi:hypothetical protein